jgi:hypothetical protein
MRIRSRLILLAVVATLGASCGVAAASTGGSLTNTEYQQMQAAQTRLKGTHTTNPLKLYKAMLWACEQTQMETPLLSSERSICDDYAQINIFGLGMKPEVTACAARYHDAKARLNCLGAIYARWDQSIQGFYASEVEALQIATARRFSGQCLAFLAGTSAQLTYAGKLATVTKQIIAATRHDDLTDFEADSGIFITDAARLQAANSQDTSKLAACPHQ